MLKMRNNRGETIIEVAIAFALITMLILGSDVLMRLALQVNRKALERSKATIAIQQQIEYLRSLRDFADGDQNRPSATFPNGWEEFCSNVLTELSGEGGSVAAFHLQRENDDDANGSSQPPVSNEVDIEPGSRTLYTELNDNDAGIYTGVLSGRFYRSNGNQIANPTPSDCDDAVRFDVTATVTWQGFGNGPTETSTMPFTIADNTWLNE